MKNINNFLTTFLLMTIVVNCYATSEIRIKTKPNTDEEMISGHQIVVIVKNQPEKPIYLARIEGSRTFRIDSISEPIMHPNNGIAANVEKMYAFQIPSMATKGMYRLIFGKTLVAELLNEPPQQLDFIFNDENIILETDFKAPFDSLKITKSQENRIWHDFLKKEKNFRKKLRYAKLEIDYCQSKVTVLIPDTTNKNSCAQFTSQYNKLQKKRNELINKTIKENPNLYASKIIDIYREPFIDGNLSKEERNLQFRNDFFNDVNFFDETLLNTSIYTDKVYRYLMSYTQKGISKKQQEFEFIKAVDKILQSVHQGKTSNPTNPIIYEFILDYLVRGFEETKMDVILEYISENYVATTCQTDKKNKLERKLAFRNMKVGTAISDFIMHDINDDLIGLSDVVKPINLIVFWTSSCHHCIEMLPKIRDWNKNENNNKLEIIAVSIDTNKTEWQDKVFELGIESWYNFSDLIGWEGETVLNYNIYATPTMFIVDQEKHILAKPANYNEFIEYFENIE